MKVSFNYYWPKKNIFLEFQNEREHMDHLIQHCQSVEKENNYAKDKNNLAKDTKPGCAQPPECYTLFSLLYLLSYTDCCTQWSDHKV